MGEKGNDMTIQTMEKTIENIENIDFSTLDYSKILEDMLAWTATTGFKLIIGVLIISIGFKIINKIVSHFVNFLEKREVDVTVIRFLNSLTSVSLKVALTIPVLGYWGIELSGIAAIVASAGVAIGLALQGSLSNFAGGFIILLIRPFKVGDYIETGIYSGVVEQIGLFYTHLTTVDNKQILIPNGILSNGSLINYSAKPTRRVDLIFSVGYENNIYQVKEVLLDVISKNEQILKDPEPFVGITAHGPSSVDFVVRVWCKTEDYWNVHNYLLETVKVRFDEEKISIPYPQMDLHLKQYKLD